MKKALGYRYPNFLMLPNSSQTSTKHIPTNPDPCLPLSSIFLELRTLSTCSFWLKSSLIHFIFLFFILKKEIPLIKLMALYICILLLSTPGSPPLQERTLVRSSPTSSIPWSSHPHLLARALLRALHLLWTSGRIQQQQEKPLLFWTP